MDPFSLIINVRIVKRDVKSVILLRNVSNVFLTDYFKMGNVIV